MTSENPGISFKVCQELDGLNVNTFDKVSSPYRDIVLLRLCLVCTHTTRRARPNEMSSLENFAVILQIATSISLAFVGGMLKFTFVLLGQA